VLLANIFAWPIAYYSMHKWLQNFAYRTFVGVVEFFAAGAMVLIIALITVSYQTLKAAAANPVDALKHE
jgi:putative ABC transport system permease protein